MRIDEIFNSTTSTQTLTQSTQAKISKRDVKDKVKPAQSNRHRRSAQFPGFQQFGGFNNPQFQQQQDTNGNAFAQNQNPYFNQNAGANTHNSNFQNQFGGFQNNGGSSIASNIGNNGQFGQLSAANTDQQSYQNAQGFGDKNNAQSQSALFDPFGLQTSAANSGKFVRKRNHSDLFVIV